MALADFKGETPGGGKWGPVAARYGDNSRLGERPATGSAAQWLRPAPEGALVWAPLPFALGIGVYFSLPLEPAVHWVAMAAGICALACLCLWGRRLLTGLFMALLLIALGFATAQLRSESLGTRLIEERWPPERIEGRIEAIEPRGAHHRILLSGLAFEADAPAARPSKVRLRLTKGGEFLSPGERVSLLAVLMPPSRPLVPGGFDFARRAYFQGIGAVGFVLGAPERLGPGREPTLWRAWSEGWGKLRLSVAERVREVVPGQGGEVAVALITGLRGGLSEETQEAMRRSGLAHLLAISGLHLGLVAMTVVFALRFMLAAVPPLALRAPIKKIAAVAGVLAAFCYLFMAGATIPAQRAFIMVAIALLAVVLERNPFSLRLVAAAALLVLALTPESLLSPSFQLSFAAVTALIAFYAQPQARRGGLEEDGPPLPGIARYFLLLAVTSLIAILATTPFALHHFGRFTPYGLFANLLAVPLTGMVIMPSAVLAAVFWPFGLEAIGLTIMGWAIELLLFVAAWVAAQPGASVALPSLPLMGLLLAVAGGLWLVLLRGRLRWLGGVLVIGGLITSPLKPLPDLLLEERLRLVALKGPGGQYYFSDLRRERFTRELWMEYLGKTQARPWREAEAAGLLRCDSQGCVLERGGLTLAISKSQAGALEDCRRVDFVIAREPLRRLGCRARLGHRDLFDFFDGGAAALTLRAGKIEIQSVEDVRGVRPWTPGKAAESDQ